MAACDNKNLDEILRLYVPEYGNNSKESNFIRNIISFNNDPTSLKIKMMLISRCVKDKGLITTLTPNMFDNIKECLKTFENSSKGNCDLDLINLIRMMQLEKLICAISAEYEDYSGINALKTALQDAKFKKFLTLNVNNNIDEYYFTAQGMAAPARVREIPDTSVPVAQINITYKLSVPQAAQIPEEAVLFATSIAAGVPSGIATAITAAITATTLAPGTDFNTLQAAHPDARELYQKYSYLLYYINEIKSDNIPNPSNPQLNIDAANNCNNYFILSLIEILKFASNPKNYNMDDKIKIYAILYALIKNLYPVGVGGNDNLRRYFYKIVKGETTKCAPRSFSEAYNGDLSTGGYNNKNGNINYYLCKCNFKQSFKQVSAKSSREAAKMVANKVLKGNKKSIKFSLKRMVGKKEKCYDYEASLNKNGKVVIKNQ